MAIILCKKQDQKLLFKVYAINGLHKKGMRQMVGDHDNWGLGQ
jgi:hypothetical protein